MIPAMRSRTLRQAASAAGPRTNLAQLGGAGRRTFAQVSDAAAVPGKTGSAADVEPYLLEELPAVQAGDKDAISKLPPFVISRERGFLPREDPMAKMPEAFAGLSSLLDRMTIHQPADANGHRATGLLGTGDFGAAVLDELKPDGKEAKAVEAAIESGNSHLLAALFRDYCFATSAYLLEPVDRAYRETGFYTQGRNVLPAQLAVPLKKLADKLGHFPYMEYASSYALVNYLCKDPNYKGTAGKYSFDNMELIRSFEDASGSERGFILVHVEMVSYTGKLVSATEDALRACAAKDAAAFEDAFERLLVTYRQINESMETMWARSLPADYLKYRSFIFGTGPKKMNAMFPEGVVYEGVSEEPQFYRGESGANDSIVPTGDNLLEITAHMPNNDLTKTLRDFRSYRPKNQREFLQHLEARATLAGVRGFAMSSSPRAKALYVLLVDQIREFRNRHWMFTKSYIIQRTTYDIATGGSPILQYLPNNLATVLKVLEESFEELTAADRQALGNEAAKKQGQRISNVELLENVTAAGKRAGAQRRMLEREVAELLAEKEKRIQSLGGDQERGRGMLGEPKSMKRGAVGCDGVG
ncbi:indoleamine 2,3-dioxygenase family protein [Moesziomyces antarcticus]|uniref:Indoleamine 2,3-dioxygenase family protein n=2 Tax=Pseudozyma antarctica TaxID=84753 RepID=A0A081CH87_PSEA2|nr:indoleamine 2,3-dioxygenase family protein [Moesziomyces antarcticus]GAK66033.1 indoleamine 2,3-dioxygenase family protein [Moesziomyces antarcticus]SPO46808.1 related to BNA2 - putative tryptophan 2,3-dioxygenase or indoleamine 2,3-dioxygenase [Moesziomyces antarcticus]